MIINQSEEIDNKNFTPNFEKSFGIKDEAFIKFLEQIPILTQ